ncbi:hypothetical protein HHI36_020139 [Cryptolaemus montrouzieri]|uniref:Transcription factor IIIC 90kDa subunit N-terminal domain-containing protein n=1 Tax=Cryptolaemus montrouzieri TaxID=559131 RepID=A0ABD2N9Q6_9CUCU
MSLTLQQIDCVAFSNKLCLNFACSSSEDGRILLITENGILVYTLMNYMDNIFNDIAFRKEYVRIPDFSLTTELGVEFESFYDQVPKEDLFERVLRLDITSKLDHSTPVDVKPLTAAWSPKGLLGKSHCVLSVLSNFYGLHIFVRSFDDGGVEHYECVTNVTKCIVEHFSKNWHDISRANVNIQVKEWNQRISVTCPTAFVWSHTITTSQETFAILFVAHPNGSITSWKFTTRREDEVLPSPLTYVGTCQTSLENINTMYWNKTRKDGGALCYGSIIGNLAVITLSGLARDNVVFKDEVIFWKENDQKKVDHITSIDYNDHTYLIVVREEFLLIFSIDKEGSVLDEVSFDLGCLPITGLCHYKDNVLLVLTTGRLKKITLDMVDSCINIKEELVTFKFDSTKFKTHGLVLSENRVYLGVLAYPCRLKDITRDPTPSSFLIYHDASISLFQTIMNNPSGSLEKYWDCFEILRLISYKEKKFPWQGIDANLDYDKLPLLQLKSLRWIAKLSEKVYNVVPSITEYNIKPYVLLHYLVTIKLVLKRMKKLMGVLANGVELTTFQMRSLDIQNMYLKEMVLMKILEKCKVGEKFVDEITEVMEKANELEYPDMPPCFWCGEKITGPTCIPVHVDSRCSISMMQIFLVPGFKCPLCKCVAHPEIAKETDVVICPYCDIPMDQIYSHEKVKNIVSNANMKLKDKLTFALKDSIPETPYVEHPIDSITENISLEDIEDSQVEYLALTDSEDEESIAEKSNYLRNKFFEIMTTNSLAGTSQDNLSEFPSVVPDCKVPAKGNESDDYSFDEDSDGEHSKSSKKTTGD